MSEGNDPPNLRYRRLAQRCIDALKTQFKQKREPRWPGWQIFGLVSLTNTRLNTGAILKSRLPRKN